MLLSAIREIIKNRPVKTFAAINFGCRVNAAETNQLSQIFVDLNLTPTDNDADLYLINTCAVTKKGEYESLSEVKKLLDGHPRSLIIATGCADLKKLNFNPNLLILDNISKDKIVVGYTPKIKDKFSHTRRYLLKVQSGCTVGCTFCTVPKRRTTLNSISIDMAIDCVNKAIKNGYRETIVTGVNLAQYQPGLSNLVEKLLSETDVNLISFGSVPLLCVDDKFISLLQKYPKRLSRFLHIPLQSGSEKILELMGRPYNPALIRQKFKMLNKVPGLSFGTDIIVGFPDESPDDFRKTVGLCRKIGFTKIHCFPYSPRPGTVGREIFLKSPKIPKSETAARAKIIARTTLPFRQRPET